MDIVIHTYWNNTPAQEVRKASFKQRSAPSTIIVRGLSGKNTIKALIANQDDLPEFDLEIGVAICHYMDDFCKKTGRAVAEKNMKHVKMKVGQLQVFDDRMNIKLFNEEEDLYLNFVWLKKRSMPIGITYRAKGFECHL